MIGADELMVDRRGVERVVLVPVEGLPGRFAVSIGLLLHLGRHVVYFAIRGQIWP